MPLIPCPQCNPTNSFERVDPDCPYCSGRGKISTDADTAATVYTKLLGSGPVPTAAPAMPARYPIAISQGSVYNTTVVIANDCTIWLWDGSDWFKLPALPQPVPEGAV